MSFVNRLGQMCDKLGANPKATYPVILIAAVKGICRPTFTMMDKTEKPETKKYTALREGLTEIIAIPTYLACGELAAHLANKIKFKNVPEDVKKSLKKRASRNFMFIGVCTAALLVIPGLCSVVIKPVMDKIMPHPDSKQANKTKPQLIVQNPLIKKPDMSKFTGRQPLKTSYPAQIHTGMKVGGV